MGILDVFLILTIHVACFWAGMHISDKYHEEQRKRVDYEVRLATARQRANDYNVYVAPVERKSKRMPIGQPFADRLKQNGRATQQINPEKPIS